MSDGITSTNDGHIYRGVCEQPSSDEIERLRHKNEWLARRLSESDNLFQVLLRDECVAEHRRESILEQIQDNMKALDL